MECDCEHSSTLSKCKCVNRVLSICNVCHEKCAYIYWKRLFQQKNETDSALQQTYDILADGFTDTATKKPQVSANWFNSRISKFHGFWWLPWQVAVETSTDGPNGTTTTTTERYRISRKELGYILGRNYRGLQKLFRIELDDALNVCIANGIPTKFNR